MKFTNTRNLHNETVDPRTKNKNQNNLRHNPKSMQQKLYKTDGFHAIVYAQRRNQIQHEKQRNIELQRVKDVKPDRSLIST